VSRVFGDPERLEAYTAEVTPAVGEARGAVEDYRAAVLAFNAAGPNHLGNSLVDLARVVLPDLDHLDELDQAPAAFGFALRHVDQLRDGLGNRIQLTDLERFEALAAARMNDPHGAPAEVVAAASDSLEVGLRWPWGDEATWAADPTSAQWWATTALGATHTTIKETWRRLGVDVRSHYRGTTRVDAHGRWLPGNADLLNRTIGQASSWQRSYRYARPLGRVLPILPGVDQAMEDRHDPSLTTGQHIARTGSRTAFEGGGGAVGAAGGAAGGAIAGAFVGSAVPVVGTVIGGAAGAVIGGIGGGIIGTEVGSTINDNVQGAVQTVGDGIDEVIDLGSQAIDSVTDVGSAVVGGVNDLGSSAAETVSGWFD
jgi:hypothetical protein